VGVDGVSLLLELLKSVQSRLGGTGAARRQGLLEELACLQCLQLALRCQDTPRRLASSSAGLFPLAASIMSNVNKSRILALQVLEIYYNNIIYIINKNLYNTLYDYIKVSRKCHQRVASSNMISSCT
jgi:hypothetical protein